MGEWPFGDNDPSDVTGKPPRPRIDWDRWNQFPPPETVKAVQAEATVRLTPVVLETNGPVPLGDIKCALITFAATLLLAAPAFAGIAIQRFLLA